jgi:hypothetical protein
MIRVSPETRARVMEVATADFGGVSADETLQLLLDEHWQAKSLAAMESFRATDPKGWAEYLREAEAWERLEASVIEPWGQHNS